MDGPQAVLPCSLYLQQFVLLVSVSENVQTQPTLEEHTETAPC